MKPVIKRSVDVPVSYDYKLSDLRDLIDAVKDFDGDASVNIQQHLGDRPYESDSYSIEITE